MSLFLGTHLNRLDPKLRVSIPAAFRSALKSTEQAGLILWPSHLHACIEAWPEPEFASLEERLNGLPLFGEGRQSLACSFYGDACRVEPDKDGRVTLPDEMVAHAGLDGAVSFVGLGRIFQIWEPAAAAAFRQAARARANLTGLTLPGAAA